MTTIYYNLEQAESAYKIYIMDHITNIKYAWAQVETLLKGEFWLDEYTREQIHELTAKHDRSKFDKIEFDAYRNNFFPYEGEIKNDDNFKKAWCHHIHMNKHHWNHWTVIDTSGIYAIEMPFKYIFEMLLDWKAMSYKFNDTASDFYKKKKSKMVLHENTEKCINRWIDIFN